MQRPILVSIVYIPPKATLNSAIECLDKLADTLTALKLEWIIMGDFNVKLANSNDSQPTAKLRRFASRNYLYQLINKPTRVTQETCSILDHIYTNINPEYTTAYVIKYGLSDHDMICLIIIKPTQPVPKESFTCRNDANYSLAALQDEIDNCDWTKFDNMLSVDEGWDTMYANYLHALNTIAPFMTIKNVKQRKSWTSPKLLRKMRQRDNLKSQADALTNNNSYKEYKKLKNKIKREVIKAKRQYIMNKISDANNNPKQYWKELNNVFNPSGSERPPPISLAEDGIDLPTEEIAEYMNTYFSEIGLKLASAITADNSSYLNSLKNTNITITNKLISWRPTNREELERPINSIDTYKSSKIYHISTRYFKDCLICSIDKACLLCNRIFLDGKFPNAWKEANIIPIFKKGNNKMVKNYRPISLLHVIGKIVEKLMHTRIYNFLEDTEYFTPYQGGFRPGHGTTETIVAMLNYIYNGLNNNEITATVFFDLSKAFDSL